MMKIQDEYANYPRLATGNKPESITSSMTDSDSWSDTDIEPIEFVSHPETQAALEIAPQNSFGEFTALIRKFEDKKEKADGLRLARESEQIESRQICTLELQNASQAGFGGVLTRPVEVGSWMTLYFPEERAMPAYDVTGEVINCTPDENDPELFKVDVSFAAATDHSPKLPQLKLAQ